MADLISGRRCVVDHEVGRGEEGKAPDHSGLRSLGERHLLHSIARYCVVDHFATRGGFRNQDVFSRRLIYATAYTGRQAGFYWTAQLADRVQVRDSDRLPAVP